MPSASKIAIKERVSIKLIGNIYDPRGRIALADIPGAEILSYCPADFCKPADHERLGVIINGRALTAAAVRGRTAKPGDEIIFYRVPGGEIGVAILVNVIIAAVLIGVSFAISAALTRGLKRRRREFEDSATYGFDGIVNTVTAGTRIPIVYGEHRFGGHVIQSVVKTPENAPGLDDHDGSNGALHTLLGICSGPIQSLTSVRADKNAITNFKAVEVHTRLGDLHQAPIEGFEDQETQYIKQDTLTYSGGALTYATVNEVDQVEVAINAPQGMGVVTNRGALVGASVGINIRWKVTGTGTWNGPLSFTVGGQTLNQFKRFLRTGLLRRAKYDIEVTRTTADATDPARVDDTEVFAITEIVSETFTYPGLALLGIRQMPTSQIAGRAPTYDVLVKGKIVKVYTSTTNYTEEWSDNPAWCVFDYLTDAFNGLGAFLDATAIDAGVIQSFLDWADFCTTENLTLNIVIDGSMTAMEAIKQMAAVGRGFIVFRGDKFHAVIDEDSAVVQRFTMGRIGKNSFNVQLPTSQDRPNFYVGRFFNKDIDYELDPLDREDPTQASDAATKPAEVELIGVTGIVQADKLLNYYILSDRLSRRMVDFETSVDAIAMEAGDIFEVAHDVPQWGWSGRLKKVLGGSGTEMILDREVTIEAGKSYQIAVIHRDSDTLETHTVSTPATSATDKIAIGGTWETLPLVGDDYSFGETNATFAKYRCVSITRGKKPWQRRVIGRQHDPNIYSDDLLTLPTPNVSQLPDPRIIPPDVTNLQIQERQTFSQDGTLINAIDLFYNPAAFAKGFYRIYWRQDDSTLPWMVGGETTSGQFTLQGNRIESPGITYQFSVVSVSQFGVSKHPDDGVKGTVTTTKTTRQPDNCSGFAADRTAEGLAFTWSALDPDDNYDLDYYEIRFGDTWGSAILVGRTPLTELRTTGVTKSPSGGSNKYLLRARNKAGNYSASSSTVTFTVDPRLNENVILTQTEDPSWSGTKVGCSISGNDLVFSGTSGSYTTAKFQVTTTAAVRSLVNTLIESVISDLGLYWDHADIINETWNGTFATTQTWSPTIDEGVSVVVEMRFSLLTSGDGDFGSWQARTQNFEVPVKWAQARIVVTITNSALELSFKKFRVEFDVPDLLDEGEETTSGSGTTQVDFNRDYQNAPRVVGSTIGGSDGDEIQISGITKDKFDVGVRNSGSWVVRTIDWHARGF